MEHIDSQTRNKAYNNNTHSNIDQKKKNPKHPPPHPVSPKKYSASCVSKDIRSI